MKFMLASIPAFLFSALLSVSTQVQASTIKVGSSLPALTIVDTGELSTTGATTSWSSQKTYNKPHILLYMAGRFSVERMIKPLTNALKKISNPNFHSTTLINGSDVTLGASAVALEELIKNKKNYPKATMVFDMQGKGLRTWQLKKSTAAVVVLNKDNEVIYFKEGALSTDDVKAVLELLK